MPPELSVVVCSYNGADGIERTLTALNRQTIVDQIEVVVVDDGSVDDTGSVARSCGARVVRHPVNRGLAAARNTGVHEAAATRVAFLDDDCEPEADWAQHIRAGFDHPGVIGVGGVIVPAGPRGLIGNFLRRNNPLDPLEVALGEGEGLGYRLRLYLARVWRTAPPAGVRPVFSFVGANMAFRRDVLVAVGGFDERFTFGAEELELCRRLWIAFPDEHLRLDPAARVEHHFPSSLRDMARRNRAYGRGNARLYRKYASVRPTFYPAPVLVTSLVVTALAWPWLLLGAALVPYVLFPDALRAFLDRRERAAVVDPFLLLLEEAMHNVGFIEGWWHHRHFALTADSSRQLGCRVVGTEPEPVEIGS